MGEIPLSFKVRNYRGFGDTFAGFETIKPINVLIGRNNSGKSALLDVVQAACQAQPTFREQDWSGGKRATLELATTVSEEPPNAIYREWSQ